MSDPASAEAMYRPPAFELLTTASDVFHLEQPAPVLWRDPDPRTDPGDIDAVLSVGELAILASAGGLGKSCLTLALAVEAAIAAEDGREYGNACGLRVKADGAVLVSYEDSPARIGNRLRWFTKTAPEGLHLWANPEPLDHHTIEGSSLGLDDLDEHELRQFSEKIVPWLPESTEQRIADDFERTRRIIDAYKSQIQSIDPTWPTLIFATSVQHAETIAALLKLEHIEARAVSSKTDEAVRRSVVERFRAGDVKVLVNYGVFREGFDAPKTQAIIVARPVYSPNLYFQMIGRGLRGELNGDSDRCLILDVEDNIENFDRALAFSELDWLWN